MNCRALFSHERSSAKLRQVSRDISSARKQATRKSALKAPIGRFADPALYEIGPQYEWNRDQLFATGALSLNDLLDRIPGVTTFRSGWLATPQTAMHMGDFRRVRIFYDGLQ